MDNTSQQNTFNITTFLVTVLIVMSFFLGSLYAKVEYLEKNKIQAAAHAQTLAENNNPDR